MMRSKFKTGSDLENIMKEFRDIALPGHYKRPGYVDTKKIQREIGISGFTYYKWKNLQSSPNLKLFLKTLNKRGYTIKIIKKDSQY